GRVVAQRQRGVQRRFFSIPGWADRGGGSGGDGGDSTGGIDAGCRSDRGGGRTRHGDGVHRGAAFQALRRSQAPSSKLQHSEDSQIPKVRVRGQCWVDEKITPAPTPALSRREREML